MTASKKTKEKARVRMWEFVHGFGCSPLREAKEGGHATACEIVRVEVVEL